MTDAPAIYEAWSDGSCLGTPGHGGEAAVVLHPKTRADIAVVVDGMTKLTRGWIRAGWRKQEGSPVANCDLWQELVSASSTRKVSWIHERDHFGKDLNERVDRLAVAEARRMKGSAAAASPSLPPVARARRRWINTKP